MSLAVVAELTTDRLHVLPLHRRAVLDKLGGCPDSPMRGRGTMSTRAHSIGIPKSLNQWRFRFRLCPSLLVSSLFLLHRQKSLRVDLAQFPLGTTGYLLPCSESGADTRVL